MGCDIHITVESRDATGAWTKHDGVPEFISRVGYAAFAALAGVRQRIPPVERVIPENRGLPKDFEWAKWEDGDYFRDDGHSANWLWLYEMDRYARRGTFSTKSEWLRGWFEKTVKWMRTLGSSDDVRMVFFFDN